MNTTKIRAGFALVGTAAVLSAGAVVASNAANAAPTAPAAASVQTGHGTGHGKGGDKAAAGRAAVTFLIECVDDNVVQTPKTFTLACGDGNQSLEKLAWKDWGHTNAFATGVVRENVSSPMSKGDKWISYPVKVKATGLVDGEASATYTKLIVRTVGKAPAGVDKLQIFDLPGVEAQQSADTHKKAAHKKAAHKKAAHKKADKPAKHINDTQGWSDGHEGMSEDYIAFDDGHAGMSDDDVIVDDGHAGMSDDYVSVEDGHAGMSNDPGVER